MTTFRDVAEVANAIRGLEDARAAILEVYPLTEDNEFVTMPPASILAALAGIRAAREHLENLCEYGSPSYRLESKFQPFPASK